MNRGKAVTQKKKTQTKETKNPAFTKPGHCMHVLFLTGPFRTSTGISDDTVKIPRCKKLVGLT